MPGIRDRNLRNGDLHEELGLFLLRQIAFVAPVPRPEDVGNDAFATLIRPDSSNIRRLIPDVSFLVQFKSVSIKQINYAGADEVAWLTNLEIPLFIGRVDLEKATVTLFSTDRLHQILLEQPSGEICLLLDRADEDSPAQESHQVRRANLGEPVLKWSITDCNRHEFLEIAFSVLKPHIELWQRNYYLRRINRHEMSRWETGKPPTPNGNMMMISEDDDASATLREMTPHIQRILMQISSRRRYGSFNAVFQFVQMMRHWGVDPDPGGTMLQMTMSRAEGPEVSIEETIKLRYLARLDRLDLGGLAAVSDESLIAIPDDVKLLVLSETLITDTGLAILTKLTGLTRLNIDGTMVTDEGLLQLANCVKLEWLSVQRTSVTELGVGALRSRLNGITILH